MAPFSGVPYSLLYMFFHNANEYRTCLQKAEKYCSKIHELTSIKTKYGVWYSWAPWNKRPGPGRYGDLSVTCGLNSLSPVAWSKEGLFAYEMAKIFEMDTQNSQNQVFQGTCSIQVFISK